ncbi:MAG: hypothetical protein HXS52_07910 [Theionarchaea archaeon]|nr:hypothetical protein [Theionarchaea archaeon]
MKSVSMAVVLIALLMLGTLGGISLGVASHFDGTAPLVGEVAEFDGDDPPVTTDSVPGSDPEHPK